MKEQQDRARAARTKVDAKVVVPDTTKLDQSKLVNDPAAEQAQIVMIGKDGVEVETAGDGEEVTLILDANPFHAEGGGQLGDTGSIRAAGGSAAVSDAKALPNGLVYLIATVKEGAIHSGDTVQLSVDKARNLALARNHTATHLLQAALRTVLGNHVNQAGSLVTPDHLRFDFTHFSPVTAAELEKVEQLVNDEILKNDVVTIEEMPIDAAKEKGAMALFGEKYGDIVRVVSVDGFSCELCGGSHVKSTAIIGSFRILSESGTGTGVRRIEAVTGAAALQKAKEDQAVLRQLATDLKAKNNEITTKVANLMSQLKEAEKELQQLKKEAALSDLDTILASQETIGGVSVVAAETQADSMDSLTWPIRSWINWATALYSSVQRMKIKSTSSARLLKQTPKKASMPARLSKRQPRLPVATAAAVPIWPRLAAKNRPKPAKPCRLASSSSKNCSADFPAAM